MTTCFESCPPNLRELAGIIAYTTGTRPSSLFGWDDPDDVAARLYFDGKIMKFALPKIAQMMGGGLNG